MPDQRPNPDELLRRLREEEQRQKRGKLTLFFGAAPGVGKTYAMLQAARRAEHAEDRDVVVGVVETHGRSDTAALLGDLELLPRRSISCHGVQLDEFDLDAALARRPALILMDELAHANAEGSRHPKRWQDVEELLDAGIDVFSTMNVQHVESLNDVIAQITGIIVRETVPDSVLEQAHEIKLVDLPPDDLLERLREGKVYVSGQAQRALENFFRKGNLIALRELALRQTAERVDAQMRAYRTAQGIEQTWATADQLLVAVSPSPYSPRLVRATRRMAAALHARWFAVNVEVTGAKPMSKANQTRLSSNLHLAQQLGAQVVTLAGEDAAQEILRFSRERNITKIIVGKPVVERWRDRVRTSLVDQLVRRSGDIDVYVTAGDAAEQERVPAQKPLRAPLPVWKYLAALAVVLVASGVSYLVFGRQQLPDVVMSYLLGIMLVASRLSLGPSLFAACMSVAAFDFFFVPPFFTFNVGDLRHTVTFFVMLLVAVVISGLTDRIRSQAAASRKRERWTAALYQLSRELAGAQGSRRVLEAGARHLEQVFASKVSIFTAGTDAALARVYASKGQDEALERDASISHWVWTHRREAGLGTSTLPSSNALYLPLLASAGIVGVLGLLPNDPGRFSVLEERRQIEAFATQLALALERAMLAEETERARREIEAEQLRNSLLSSVSHDLRTPLAVITGAASTLLQQPAALDEVSQQDLTKTILEEAERLNRLIRNLLDMTRLESGAVKVRKEWSPLEEVIGSALDRLEARLSGRDVHVELPRDLPLVPFDPVLLEQVLVNLLENAVKYSAGAIEISASRKADEVEVEIADRGPGIPLGQEERVFEKFHREVNERSPSGVGLGLTICRAIVAAHEGRIWARNREGGGAAFHFALPIVGQPPTIPPAEPGLATAAEQVS
ncbi:MAG TPA: sensor histidine kinase KdpD [Polyangiaceae bacterium]|nr:sensor histidine kinase KdpD [Polyangiaceae bacterium]